MSKVSGLHGGAQGPHKRFGPISVWVVADLITLRGLAARGRHGWHDEERQHGQLFQIDVILELDTAKAAATDDLADTVDYGALARQVIALVEGESVRLIETLAERVANLCLISPLVQHAEVTVHKPEAPLTVPFDDVAVTIRRSRS
jgi:7,8-dihydroneopterin aldolase/epimerase/oxygenase